MDVDGTAMEGPLELPWSTLRSTLQQYSSRTTELKQPVRFSPLRLASAAGWANIGAH